MKSAKEILEIAYEKISATQSSRSEDVDPVILDAMEEYASQHYTEAELLARLEALKKECAEIANLFGHPDPDILSIDINKHLKK